MYTGPQISHILGITIDYPMDICSSKDFQRSQTPFQETKDDGGAHRSGGFRPYQNGGLWVMSEWSETLGSGHSHGPQWSVGVWYVWCCTSLESSLGPSLQQFGLAQHETNFEEIAGSQAGHGPQKNPGYVVSQYPSWWSEPWVNCHLVCHRNSAWNQWTCQAYMRCKLCPVAYPGFVEEEWHPIRPSQLANDVQFLPVCIGSSKKKAKAESLYFFHPCSPTGLAILDLKGQIHTYHRNLIIVEGSLEVKLPTIWTDEKQSREEAERRERLEERRVEEKE